MTLRGFYILILATILAVGGAVGVLYQRNAAAIGVIDSEPVFPGLTDRLNDVAKVTISAEGETSTLVKQGEGWVVAESHDYPAKGEAVRALLLALADLRTMEAKTSRPEMFARLGVDSEVDAPGAEKSTATLISLEAAGGGKIAEILVGKKRYGRGGQADAHYVRLPDANQVWLAESRLDPRAEPIDWVDRLIADIDRGAVRQVTIASAEGAPLVIGKDSAEATDFVIRDMPDGAEIENQFQLNATAGTMDQLVFDAVRPAEGLDFGGAGTRYETFDGLVVEVDFADADGKPWTRYRASTLPDASEAAKSAAAAINQRTQGWAYALTDFKIEQLRRRLDQLLKQKKDAS
ncbi:DUF4340 domain-containing protein [Oceanibaculum pacificum]|uniref:DUF4340 domain-containing protein n=1 Tax=Oceanibaculum pacificum TaxID=580166 RepID=A0A154WGD5_9PROT|nr:DUF4340 domain-containing protein [Oceanibaculum pacificum]KZD12590.1 hypothetical protein AUP43_04370 [Oceanibaculum pacificum]